MKPQFNENLWRVHVFSPSCVLDNVLYSSSDGIFTRDCQFDFTHVPFVPISGRNMPVFNMNFRDKSLDL